MSPPKEPKIAADPDESEFELNDAGWDPYITSLLTGSSPADQALADEEDEGTPVMSFSRKPGFGTR